MSRLRVGAVKSEARVTEGFLTPKFRGDYKVITSHEPFSLCDHTKADVHTTPERLGDIKEDSDPKERNLKGNVVSLDPERDEMELVWCEGVKVLWVGEDHEAFVEVPRLVFQNPSPLPWKVARNNLE
uniref:Uncharacterized protein n=1 Tax=Cannabis sativa TaxID=3483 RepID=A0A803PSE1_CANSA